MTRSFALLAAFAALSLAAFPTMVIAAEPAEPLPPCAAATPAAVLDCLSAALNAGDMNALDRLLARDFVADHKPPKDGRTPDPAGRVLFLKMMQGFFTSDRVERYAFSFTFEGEPRQTEPGTWVLDEVPSRVEVFGTVTVATDGKKSGVRKPVQVEKVDSFEIREVHDPVAPPGEGRHFVIARWTEGP